jgi:hypothetical protein
MAVSGSRSDVHKRVAVDEGPRCRRDYLGVDQRDSPSEVAEPALRERNSHAPAPPQSKPPAELCARPRLDRVEVLVDKCEARGDPPTSVAFICIG